MATRRHRIVIKPNLRPAAAKTSSATPKAKATPVSATSSELSTAKSQSAPPQVEDGHQVSTDAEEKSKQTTSDVDNSQDLPTVADSLSGKDVLKSPLPGGNDIEKKVFTSSKECKREKAVRSAEDDNEIETATNLSNNNELNNFPSPQTTPSAGSQQRKRLTSKTSITDVSGEALQVSEDVTDGTELTKSVIEQDGEEEATPSEAGGISCMSEAMSLEPEDERRGEVDDEAQKKPRRRRSKKQRTEPLPSREKSPDRQKMKMSDLLSWNPQQNFFPKKNKKKTTPLKDENQPASPASSIAADDDKESTNQSASLPAPQVMIGPDGSVVLNTESLLIQTPVDDSKPKEIIEEDDDDRYLNTNTYRKHKKTKLWTEKETEKFFLGLSMCGTDFSLLTNLLSHRSRRELKNKFRREERRNRPLIDKALANRQQYDLAPFEKMAVEDEKKAKKEIKKRMKKESSVVKKSENLPKRKRGRKRKQSDSEDEEDDWGPEYDEEDEEDEEGNNNDTEKTPKVSKVKQQTKQKNSSVKVEATYPNKPLPAGVSTTKVIEEKQNVPFVPGYSRSAEKDSSRTEISSPQFSDLDNPRMRSKPTKTYSRLGPENATSQPQTINSAAGISGASNLNVGASLTGPRNNPIHIIPGSSQVQIEMEGVRNPVQGVLIPSHIVPQIAPQLGIHGGMSGMQVLLVQEEAESGSLVHVYIIPEGEAAKGPGGSNASSGGSRPSSHPAFSSPIPSPHPTTPIQSPHPFAEPYSPHPLAPARSPHPNTPIQSPPPIFTPQQQTTVQRHAALNPLGTQMQNSTQSSSAIVQNLFSAQPNSSSYTTDPNIQSLSQTSGMNNSNVNFNNSRSTHSSGAEFHLPQIQAHSMNAGHFEKPHHSMNAGHFQKPHQFVVPKSSTNPSQNVAVVIPAPTVNQTTPSQSMSSVSNVKSTSDTRTPALGISSEITTNNKVTADGSSSSNSDSAGIASTTTVIVDIVKSGCDGDEDCMIVNSNDPQSQLDTSSMSYS